MITRSLISLEGLNNEAFILAMNSHPYTSAKELLLNADHIYHVECFRVYKEA